MGVPKAVQLSLYVGESAVIYDDGRESFSGYYVAEGSDGEAVKVSVGGSYETAEECFEAVKAAKGF